MPVISIVTPVYNSEKYLPAYFESLRRQTFTDFEVLVVDDGSSDFSLEICQRYSNSDRRIKVISQEKSGVSASRNKALDEASGEWICIIDSDDYVSPLFLEKLLSHSSCKVDVIECYATFFYSSGSEISYIPFETKNVILSGPQWKKRVAENFTKDKVLPRTVLYRRSIIEKNKLRFNCSYSIYEDVDFVLRVSEFCSNVYVETEKLYFYRKHENSLTSSGGISEKQLSALLFLQQFEKFGIENNDIYLRVLQIYASFYKDALLNNAVLPQKTFESNTIKVLKEEIKRNYRKASFKSLYQKTVYKALYLLPCFLVRLLLCMKNRGEKIK